MTALVKLHINYLVSEKVFLFTVFLLILSMMFMLYVSNVYEEESTLLYYQAIYKKAFVSEVVTFGKLLIMVYLLFVMIVGYILHHYDVIVLNRTSVLMLKASKAITILCLVWYLTIGYFGVFFAIGLYLVPYFDVGKEEILLVFDMMFFGFFYTTMFIYLYETCRHLLGFIGGFLGYLLLFIGSVEGVKRSEVTTLLTGLYRIGLDLGYYRQDGYGFFYSRLYYLGLLGVIGTILFVLRKNADLLN